MLAKGLLFAAFVAAANGVSSYTPPPAGGGNGAALQPEEQRIPAQARETIRGARVQAELMQDAVIPEDAVTKPGELSQFAGSRPVTGPALAALAGQPEQALAQTALLAVGGHGSLQEDCGVRGTQSLTDGQRQSLREVFDRFDRDGDGEISDQDLVNAMHASSHWCPGDHRSQCADTDEQIQGNVITPVDTDGTGTINLVEWFRANACSHMRFEKYITGCYGCSSTP